MDLLTAQWLSELEVDDPAVIHQWQLKSVKDSLDNLCTDEYSRTEAVPEASQAWISQPARQAKINNDLSAYTTFHKTIHDQEVSSAPPTKIISFGNLDSHPISMDDLHGKLNWTHEMSSSAPVSWGSVEELYGAPEFGEPIKREGTRTPLETQHNALAERKRRERLTELFIALSTIIPGLKKLDKASVLAGAIEYLKQLEERIKVLEEEKKRQYEKSVSVTSKRPRLSSYDQSLGSILEQSSPEIEVKNCDGNVLLGIYCRKRPELIKDIFCEMEKLHLCINSTSVIPFGNTTLHITITAQESGEFRMRAEDLANTMRRSILKLI